MVKIFNSIILGGSLTLMLACGGGGGGPEPDPEPPVGNNKAPVLTGDKGESLNGAVITVDSLANDNDPEGDSLTITSVTRSQFGEALIVDNTIQITPLATLQAGTETINYSVSDGNGNSVSSSINLTYTQSVTIKGKVLGLSGESLQLDYSLGSNSFSADVAVEGDFEFTVKGQDLSQLVQLTANNGVHTLSGYSKSLESLIELSDQNRELTSGSSQLAVITPASSVYESLLKQFLGSQERTDEQLQAFELNLDADVLLETAAMVKMFSQDNINLPDGISLLEDFINNKEVIWSYSQSLVVDDETLTNNGSASGSLVKGIALHSAKLDSEIQNLKNLIQPYIKPRLSTENATPKRAHSANKNGIAEDTITYYQLRPGHQGRIANYDFSGAILTLNNDGTGYYQNEDGAGEFSWVDDEGITRITFAAPIVQRSYTSAATLYVTEVVPASFFDNLSSEIKYQDAYFDLSLNSIDIQFIADNDYVDLASLTFNHTISAQAIWPDESFDVESVPRYQEFRESAKNSTIPFTSEEVTGQWGMVVMIAAELEAFDGEISVDTNIFSDLLTFNADGTGTAEFAVQSLTWSISNEGVLMVTQSNGATLQIIRLDEDGKAYGALILAELDSKKVSGYRMVIKKEIESFNFDPFATAYLQASWGLANPQNYNGDNQLSQKGYFGFKINGEGLGERLVTYLSLSGAANTFEFITRIENRFVDIDDNNDVMITSRALWDADDNFVATYSDCDTLSSNCYVWRKRQWIPLAQDDNRIYMLEPQYFDWQAGYPMVKPALDDIDVKMSPAIKSNYYEIMPYPELP